MPLLTQQVDEARVALAIKGAILADIASMGSDNMSLDDLRDKETPEFNDPPSPVGYSSADYPGHYDSGMLSPWGEQLLFATLHVGKEKLVTAGTMSVDLMKWAETSGGYKDEGIKDFLKCMKAGDRSVELCGMEDDRAAAFSRIIPTICLYAGEVDMLERVKETVMVYQKNPKAIRFCCAAAHLLQGILLGKTLKETMENLVNHVMSSTTSFSTDDTDIGDACLHALMEAKMKELPDVVEGMMGDDEEEFGGNSARFPSAFILPMFMLYKSMADGDTTEESYIKTIRSNIQAGGSGMCLRAIFLGAVLASAAGSIPASFEEKFSKETMAKVDHAVKEICSVLN